MRTTAIVLLFLAATTTTRAAQIVVTRDGAAVADAQVCRFAAKDADNPFRRWLASSDVTCVSAAADVVIPSGMWNVFARTSGELSATLLVNGETASSLTFALAPAARLSASLPPANRGVVYARRSGRAFPIDGATLVPAGEELWLFVVEGSAPVVVVPVAAIEAGAERTVDARGGSGASLLTWIEVPAADRAGLRSARNLAAPHAAAGAVEGEPLPDPAALHGAFALVRGVSAGTTELALRGRGWLPFQRSVKIGASRLTVVDEPLIARGAASLIVSWSGSDDLVALNQLARTCEAHSEPPQYQLTLSSCPPATSPAERLDAASCQQVRQQTFVATMKDGVMTVDDVPPGRYRAELRFGSLPPIESVAVAPPLQLTRMRIQAVYNELYGSLTRGGEPLTSDAAITFRGGAGLSTHEKSEYRAVMAKYVIETDDVFDIATCDGKLRGFVLADGQSRPRTRLDLDLPDNMLTISVTDTFTGMAVPGATVKYVVMSKRGPRRAVVTRTLAPVDGSRFVITFVPEREVRLTVSAPGYQKVDVEPFTMLKTDHKTIDAQLVPLRGAHGTIVSAKLFDAATIIWYSPSRGETERADVATDGTFVYARSHTADETIAVVSLSHPLWVTRAPESQGDTAITLAFPNAPVRQFDVAMREPDKRTNRYISLAIGGIHVPLAALAQHATLRRMPSILRGESPLPIADIAETGPIDVLLGPTVPEVPSRWLLTDLFAMPQFADAPRKRLQPGATSIVFDAP
jgi:hypothetical protein